MHPTSASLMASVFAAAASFAGTAQAATVTMISDTARWADASGFSGWLGSTVQLYSETRPAQALTATRPNGQSTWDRSWQDNVVAYGPGWSYDPTTGLGSPLATRPTASDVSDWSRDNFRGTWSIGWEGSTIAIDTTSAFVASNARTYAQLDAASISGFMAARANGTTGTLHLNLAQSVESYGAIAANVLLFSPTGRGTAYSEVAQVTSGSTIGDFSITSPMAADSVIQITLFTNSAFTVGDHTVRVQMGASTWYGGASAVPAPGALALVGIAGLGSRRRR